MIFTHLNHCPRQKAKFFCDFQHHPAPGGNGPLFVS